MLAIIVLLIGLWMRRDTLNPPNNNQPQVQAEQSSDSSSNSSSNSPESATSSDYIDTSTPALSPEQDEPANPQDMQTVSNDVQDSQDSQDSERIAAELELAKAKEDLLLAERELMEERRLAAESNSNYVPQDKTTDNAYIPCEYTASSPLVCESRKNQPAMCAWNYFICGAPRLQKNFQSPAAITESPWMSGTVKLSSRLDVGLNLYLRLTSKLPSVYLMNHNELILN